MLSALHLDNESMKSNGANDLTEIMTRCVDRAAESAAKGQNEIEDGIAGSPEKCKKADTSNRISPACVNGGLEGYDCGWLNSHADLLYLSMLLVGYLG